MKILYVVGNFTCGGIETSTLNIIDNINQNKYEIDVLLFEDSPRDWIFQLENRNIKVFHIPGIRNGIFKFINNINKIIIDNNYFIVHSHVGYLSVFVAIACKLNHTNCICQSHGTDAGAMNKYIPIFKFLFTILKPVYLADSIEAGYFLFGKKKNINVIFNAIDNDNFSFNFMSRKTIRKLYNFDDNVIVLGYVARLSREKNHDFIIRFLAYLNDQRFKLLLVGDGVELLELKKLVKTLNIEEQVIFAGSQTNISDYLCAMDIFLFPSKNEGFGISLLEAQSIGLNIIAFDSIPKLVNVTGLITFLESNSGYEEWKNCLERILKEKVVDRQKYSCILNQSDFGLEHMIYSIEEIYDNFKIE